MAKIYRYEAAMTLVNVLEFLHNDYLLNETSKTLYHMFVDASGSRICEDLILFKHTVNMTIDGEIAKGFAFPRKLDEFLVEESSKYCLKRAPHLAGTGIEKLIEAVSKGGTDWNVPYDMLEQQTISVLFDVSCTRYGGSRVVLDEQQLFSGFNRIMSMHD